MINASKHVYICTKWEVNSTKTITGCDNKLATCTDGWKVSTMSVWSRTPMAYQGESEYASLAWMCFSCRIAPGMFQTSVVHTVPSWRWAVVCSFMQHAVRPLSRHFSLSESSSICCESSWTFCELWCISMCLCVRVHSCCLAHNASKILLERMLAQQLGTLTTIEICSRAARKQHVTFANVTQDSDVQ